MRTSEARITLERLKEGLREDPEFPREALHVLTDVDPQSTHTTATSAESLVEWWLTERELMCYERGEAVKDTTTVRLFGENGKELEAAERAIELAWRVDRAEFVLLLFRYDMHIPAFLRDLAPPATNDGPNAMGYTIEEAALEVAAGWPVPKVALQERLRDAVDRGELEVVDPQTGLPYRPTVKRDYYERIPTAKLNAWFANAGVPYRVLGIAELPPTALPSTETTAQARDTPIKRKFLIDKLRRRYPSLENALRTNEPEFVACRVPHAVAPGKKGGFYYLECVAKACTVKWPDIEGDASLTTSDASSRPLWGMKNGKKFGKKS